MSGGIALLTGSGFDGIEGLEIHRRRIVDTPYGAPSAALQEGRIEGVDVLLLARHGEPHTVPPHDVNYRANIWALHSAGVARVIGLNTVGAIAPGLLPGSLAVPDQIIDYTYSRAQTFFGAEQGSVKHADFTRPYDEALRIALLAAAEACGVPCAATGTMGVTQGPRLETAAEIDRLERDGCDLVGMTAMPEAALARELDIAYANCAIIVNPAAGRGASDIYEDIHKYQRKAMEHAVAVIRCLLTS